MEILISCSKQQINWLWLFPPYLTTVDSEVSRMVTIGGGQSASWRWYVLTPIYNITPSGLDFRFCNFADVLHA